MTDKSPRKDFNETAPKAEPTHALVVEGCTSFPKGSAPIGTTAELAKIYEQLLAEQLDGVPGVAVKQAILGFNSGVTLYKLDQLPATGPKGGLLGTGIELPSVSVDKKKIIKSIDNFDSQKIVDAAKDIGMDAAALWISKFNPILWGKMAKRVDTARKVGTEAATNVASAAKDFYSQMTENMTGDAFLRDGVPYVKTSWLENEENATELPNLDALSEKPKAKRAPRGGNKLGPK